VFTKYKGCKAETICDIDCWVPPPGKGINIITGAMVDVETLSCSSHKKDQVWFRTELPANYKKLRAKELQRQEQDETFVDQELEAFRVQEMTRRINGVHVMINGKSTYITGLHYFYLNWWNIGVPYPEYRDADRRYFYFSMYCTLNPDCLGFIEVTRRKAGKSARGGCWQLETISRTKNAQGGIQSKTGDDAKQNIFQRYTVSPFRKLPDFFQPIYDKSKGDAPNTELRFFATSRKGKYAGTDDDEVLESFIDWRTTKKNSYDSQDLITYLCDEAGKFVDLDVYELHSVVRYCCEYCGGKMLYTTTVEEMEQGGAGFMRLVKASNQLERDDEGRTETGLFTFFMGAEETMYVDKYGMADAKKGRETILKRRADLQGDLQALNAHMRAQPLSLDDVFRIAQADTMFNVMNLNDRKQVLDYMDQPFTRGNFMWKNNIPYTEAYFKPSANGRWQVSWLFDKEEDANNVEKRGTLYYPGNKLSFVTGSDPYDHDMTVDGRRSRGAALTKRKRDVTIAPEFPNNSFVCFYNFRQRTSKLFYEDMILQCFYYGSPILFENQKPGAIKHFQDNGFAPFIIWLPGSNTPGIASSQAVKDQIAEVTEDYIENHIDKVNFVDLIKDWIIFDITKTQKYDPTMAAGYTLIADRLVVTKAPTKIYEVKELFRRRRIPAR